MLCADCLPDFDSTNPFGGDGTAIFDNLVDIGQAEDLLNVMCTRSSSNNHYCGLLLNVLTETDPSNPTTEQCQDIADFGFCLGTIRVAFEVRCAEP